MGVAFEEAGWDADEILERVESLESADSCDVWDDTRAKIQEAVSRLSTILTRLAIED